MKLPIETGKRGETMSLPSVADYLKEICKEDNVDVNEYLAKHNETRTLSNVNPDHWCNISLVKDYLINPKMTYDWKDRIKSVWLSIQNIKYSGYRPFDFTVYAVGDKDSFHYKTSTPWKRFKKFLKHQWFEIKWAWNYTPEHIKHFNKNKPRIGWFENKLKDLFFLNWDDKKDQTIKELIDKGYQVKDNRIWHEPIPLDKNKNII